MLQVDTRLNLGTSGGALINLKGELIGITTSLAALEGYESSVGYAIPFDAATRRIVESLARGHEVENDARFWRDALRRAKTPEDRMNVEKNMETHVFMQGLDNTDPVRSKLS